MTRYVICLLTLLFCWSSPAMGPNTDFRQSFFAEQTGGSWWRQWAEHGVTRRTPFRRFGRAFHQAVERADVIHFTLDGIEDVSAAVRLGQKGFIAEIPFVRAGNMTNAELHYFSTRPDLLEKTLFYRNGKLVLSPF